MNVTMEKHYEAIYVFFFFFKKAFSVLKSGWNGHIILIQDDE